MLLLQNFWQNISFFDKLRVKEGDFFAIFSTVYKMFIKLLAKRLDKRGKKGYIISVG